MRALVIAAILVGWLCGIRGVHADTGIPDDFPRFLVPGHDAEMDSLRRLMWLHYPGAGPKATLWDEWLSGAALWPAESHHMPLFRAQWDDVLSRRIIEPDGYVATHQHPSIAHPLGWPFPFWNQGCSTGWGWHFSLEQVPPGWHATEEKSQDGWALENAADRGIAGHAWNIELTEPGARITAPPMAFDTFQAPFMQLRWRVTDLRDAEPFLEWRTAEEPAFSPDRRMYFPAPAPSEAFAHTAVPLYTHPRWTGRITGLRIGFDNAAPGATVQIQALFTQYDTRHTINGQNYVRGCAKYFWWTRDVDFLRRNINRMRLATAFTMREFDTENEGVVVVRWVGHDGRSGIVYDEEGAKSIRPGYGIGNNYWDLMPMGHKDALATIYHYDALLTMAQIERDILHHPEWGVPRGALALDPERLEAHAAQVKRTGNRLFWNGDTKRFACSIDADGTMWDYGYTFLNLEAVHFGFATPRHAGAILDWVCGDRVVAGDTAQGADIYAWRFGPRATTKRNIDYYVWVWSNPESIPFGGQVQDGGAVLGWSYHDLMARLNVRGPDNAAERLAAIASWFDEVAAAGGYRAYYDGSRPGTLQGGGTAGGLGLDKEFFESVLVPQVMVDGFLGFRPTADGCRVAPRLPSDWPELAITRIRIHGLILSIRARHDGFDLTVDETVGPADAVFAAEAPPGWTADAPASPTARSERESALPSWVVPCRPGTTIRFQPPAR
ncbi:MAG: hypothetical protein JXR94_24005 [Candidatus Hydrogenedentes bacterium]|nr:hypothetical protein [Candidatus Hydrogenedentota bacterium]